MTRKRCHRKPIVLQLPPGMRPKLSASQLLNVSLYQASNLHAIWEGTAEPAILWDLARSVLTWSQAAKLAGRGVPEMTQQLEMVERLIERFRRTNRVLFNGPDYQLAKLGLAVMDELAASVDKAVAISAAMWSDREVERIAATMRGPQEHAA